MPIEITALPLGPDTTWTTPAQDSQSWADSAWAWITEQAGNGRIMYAATGLLAVLLLLSLRSRRKRDKAEAAGRKADLTRTDRAVTLITGILATAMLATGAWKVFGDVLHLHPAVRLVLFFFAEAQIVSAWRRVRRHIYRHHELGPGIRTIYGIAFGSALIAAFDADNLVEVAVRLFAATVAAYMIAEELAEELDIHLTAHPHLRSGDRPRRTGQIRWAFDLERILVWLRLAQATDRRIEDVERARRIAQLSRVSYRLQMLKDRRSETRGRVLGWRITYVRWRQRRLTEAANEHLKLATNKALLAELRAQAALLYGAENGMSRHAVRDLHPWAPTEQLAITATPFIPPRVEKVGEVEAAAETANPVAVEPANTPAVQVAITDVIAPAVPVATEVAETPATEAANGAAVKVAIPAARRPATRRATKPAIDVATEGVHPTAVKLAKYLAKYPAETNAELAKRMRVGDRTVSRYRAEAEAFNLANAQPLTAPQHPPMATLPDPISEPKQPVSAGINGRHPTLTEETQ